MAKFVIEFDETKGCKECPYCKFLDSNPGLLDFGWYCTKESPNKKLLDAYSWNLIKIPEWCTLSKHEINKYQDPVDHLIQPIFNYSPKTIKLKSQCSISKYEEKYIGADKLKDIVKHRIIRLIADSELFRQSINFREVYDEWSESRKFIGELEIVNKNVASKEQRWDRTSLL